MLARLVLLALLATAALAQSSSNLFRQVDEMTSALSEITGWQVKRKVPAQMLSKEKFHHYLESRMNDGDRNADVRAEELTLKMFGFVPQDFDLAKQTIDLVSEQAAAYYDYNRKRLYILDSSPDDTEQRVALVHELAHALADQHHPLGKFLKKGDPDDDESAARQAVMEGQATWLTWAYVSKRNGGKAEVPEAMLDELTKAVGADGADFPVYSKAPLYMRESLTFPYSQGMRFQDAVFHKLGREGFDEVFLRAPLDTEQILHPADYFSNKKPAEIDPPSLETMVGNKESRRFRVLVEGMLGEFDFSVLLRQYVSERTGEAAATHWRGSAYRLYEHKRGKYPVLTFASAWDSDRSAQTFFRLYQAVMKGKWKKMSGVTSTQDGGTSVLTGVGDSGRFRLSVSGTTVQSIEGLPAAATPPEPRHPKQNP
ncbi:MAG TPA: hypothetical protein VK419_04260 [Bryobacteraceae bacterium]|nr:hypothetical protein [Bryobacteraceae bacterium]